MKKEFTTVYMVRHGTTALNEKLCAQGWYDEPLNEVGLRQGALLYDYFKDIPIDIGYSSPLKRASQTMDRLLGERDVPVVYDDDLKELHFGDIEGRPFAEINMIFSGALERFLHHSGGTQYPGGESGEEAFNRVVNGIKRIVSENPGKTIVMTYHGFAIQCWLNYLKGRNAVQMEEQVLNNVSVCKFTFDKDLNVTTDYIGDSRHIPEALIVNYDWSAIPLDQPLLLCYSKCGTCRKAKKFLQSFGIDFQERDLVKLPLHVSEIEAILPRYQGEVKKLFNTSGMVYRQMGLKDLIPNMDRDDMIAWLATDGKLVKRPILIMKDQVLVGFKEDQWKEVFGLN